MIGQSGLIIGCRTRIDFVTTEPVAWDQARLSPRLPTEADPKRTFDFGAGDFLAALTQGDLPRFCQRQDVRASLGQGRAAIAREFSGAHGCSRRQFLQPVEDLAAQRGHAQR